MRSPTRPAATRCQFVSLLRSDLCHEPSPVRIPLPVESLTSPRSAHVHRSFVFGRLLYWIHPSFGTAQDRIWTGEGFVYALTCFFDVELVGIKLGSNDFVFVVHRASDFSENLCTGRRAFQLLDVLSPCDITFAVLIWTCTGSIKESEFPIGLGDGRDLFHLARSEQSVVTTHSMTNCNHMRIPIAP